MHALKGGWVGQTFALAKRNESEGRKSRIRRSKEERKAMVETFIKKYQDSNKGNFPSLNLTHKEVGGSFYTVREIVRDIIQENRVLGPAKFTLEELTSNKFLEQDPLGSIVGDPQTYLVTSSNENHLEPYKLQDTSEKMLSGLYTVAEHQMFDNGNALHVSQVDVGNKECVEVFGNGRVINGSQVDETNKESVDASSPEFEISEPLAPIKNVEQDLTTPMANATPLTADMIVETFPLRPATSTANRIEAFGEFRDSSNSPEKEMEILELEKGKERSEQNNVDFMKNSDLFNGKSVNDLENIIVEKNCVFGNEEEEKNVAQILVESTNHATLEETFGQEFEVCTDRQVKLSRQSIVTSEAIEQSQMIDGIKTSVQDGFHTKNLTNTFTGEAKSIQESLESVDEHRVDDQPGSSKRRSNPTLDRINLESWDRMPKNSVKQEPNPLLAIFRAFVDAFVKFWSE